MTWLTCDVLQCSLHVLPHAIACIHVSAGRVSLGTDAYFCTCVDLLPESKEPTATVPSPSAASELTISRDAADQFDTVSILRATVFSHSTEFSARKPKRLICGFLNNPSVGLTPSQCTAYARAPAEFPCAAAGGVPISHPPHIAVRRQTAPPIGHTHPTPPRHADLQAWPFVLMGFASRLHIGHVENHPALARVRWAWSRACVDAGTTGRTGASDQSQSELKSHKYPRRVRAIARPNNKVLQDTRLTCTATGWWSPHRPIDG